jgi:plasmid stabilization system protein ParE
VKQYHIIIEPEAMSDLENIYNFIATEDTPIKAQRFLRKLQTAISTLNFMPERFRKSIYINDEKTHDMVIHGYTVCYHIAEKSVHIVAVFRQKAF